MNRVSEALIHVWERLLIHGRGTWTGTKERNERQMRWASTKLNSKVEWRAWSRHGLNWKNMLENCQIPLNKQYGTKHAQKLCECCPWNEMKHIEKAKIRQTTRRGCDARCRRRGTCSLLLRENVNGLKHLALLAVSWIILDSGTILNLASYE